MRVTVDLSPSVQGRAGLGRYAQELTRALLETTPGDETLGVFINDSRRRCADSGFAGLPVKRLALSNKPWRMSTLLGHFLRLPQDGWVGKPDVFLATEHLLPYFRRTRSVFTLHDLIFKFFPAAHLPLNRWFLNLMMPRFLRDADAVIAVSECTRRDAIRCYRLSAGKIHVIYEGVNARFRQVKDQASLDEVRRRYQLPARFILCVGTIEPRKNLAQLFEAFRMAQLGDMQLVVVGRKGWLFTETFARLRALGLENRTVFTGFVPDDDLPALYSAAQVFAFPSLYEGFGLPVLEAMACATPVVCSRAASLPEVAGDAAWLVAPDDVRGWSEALSRLVLDAALRAELGQRGQRQAARFSWAQAARQTRQLYREVYARPH
jgi:glycosyltransferase involved in cell wall biosynthesis